MTPDWRQGHQMPSHREQELRSWLDSADQARDVSGFEGRHLDRDDVIWVLLHYDGGRGPVDLKDSDWGPLVDVAPHSVQARKGIRLQGADLSDADLHELPLGRADLRRTNLTGTNLHKAELVEADLRDATMGGQGVERTTSLAGADMRRIDLRGAYDLSGVRSDVSFGENANLNGADLRGVHLEGAQLQKADLKDADLREANLYDADLRGACLQDARLDDANLSGARLYGAHLQRARLSRARLRDIGLFDGNEERQWGRARLADANWDGANLADVAWKKCRRLGDEGGADELETPNPVRAYRQLAILQRNQGLTREAARFDVRARQLERRWAGSHRLGRFGWLISWFASVMLELVSGFGYRPGRTVGAYLVTVGAFAWIYHQLKLAPDLNAVWYSFIAINGRAVMNPNIEATNAALWIPATEAVLGLFIEAILVATLVRWLFRT